jgi:peptidoglycan/xylan/chitin deacetylase (PgdA/CDA1 family)
MAGGAKSAIKRLLYAGGALSLYHRLRNRSTLTVAMFHRVFSLEDRRWNGAFPDWTLAEDVFDDCLKFFKRHYTIVGLQDLLASLCAELPLPSRSLLLTFDDGYADNEEYALRALRRHRLPAVVFVISDAVGQKNRPWTEDFLWAYLSGGITSDEVTSVHELLNPGFPCSPDNTLARVWDIVRRGPQLSEPEVQVALSKLRKPLTRVNDPAQMLSIEQMHTLVRHGVAIGAHGKTHTAFPVATDLTAELREPRRVLENVLATEPHDPVNALSFPHGAHTSDIVDRAFQEGYRLIFTSCEELSPVTRGRLRTPVIGRINVTGPAFAPQGRLRPDLLAFHFFRRPHAKLKELRPYA